MNTRLMVPVERIVRPVLAPVLQKLRMREELYAHLEQVYLEELQLSEMETTHAPASDESDRESIALSAALIRFGNPGELQIELQNTISKQKQMYLRFDHLFLRRPAESRFRFAMRISTSSSFLLSLWILLSFSVLYAITHNESVFLIIPFLVLLCLVWLMNTFVCLFLAQRLIEPEAILQQRQGFLHYGFLFGLSTACGVALLWTSIPGWYESLLLPHSQPLFAFLAGWGMFSLITWLVKKEREQTIPWETLDLSQ